MEIVLFWILLAVTVGIVAGSRGRNGVGWFLLAVLISPLIAGFLVLALPTPAAIKAQGPSKTCPRCAEEVRAAAKVCRHCGYEFPDASAELPEAPRSQAARPPSSSLRPIMITIVVLAIIIGGIAWNVAKPPMSKSPVTGWDTTTGQWAPGVDTRVADHCKRDPDSTDKVWRIALESKLVADTETAGGSIKIAERVWEAMPDDARLVFGVAAYCRLMNMIGVADVKLGRELIK